MTNKQQKVESILTDRFGQMETQKMGFLRRRVLLRDIQFLDVKHMCELLHKYRRQVRTALRAVRLMREIRQDERDPIEQLFLGYESELLDRRLADCLRLWFVAHKDYHLMRRAYLARCQGKDLKRKWDDAA